MLAVSAGGNDALIINHKRGICNLDPAIWDGEIGGGFERVARPVGPFKPKDVVNDLELEDGCGSVQQHGDRVICDRCRSNIRSAVTIEIRNCNGLTSPRIIKKRKIGSRWSKGAIAESGQD